MIPTPGPRVKRLDRRYRRRLDLRRELRDGVDAATVLVIALTNSSTHGSRITAYGDVAASVTDSGTASPSREKWSVTVRVSPVVVSLSRVAVFT